MKFKSIQFSVAALAGAIVLSVVAALVLYALFSGDRTQELVTQRTRAQFEQAVEQRLSALARTQVSEITRELESPLAIAAGLARINALIGMKDAQGEPQLKVSREQLINMLHETVVQKTKLLGSYIAWEPNALDHNDAAYADTKVLGIEKSGRMLPWWYRKQDGTLALESLADVADQKILSTGIRASEYYLCSKDTRKACVIDPAPYRIGDKMVMLSSFIEPIIIDGAFQGIVGADLSVNFIQDMLNTSDKKLYDGAGELALIATNGRLVAYTKDINKLGEKASDVLDASKIATLSQTAMIQQLQSGTRQVVKVMEDSQTKTDESVGHAAMAAEALETITKAVSVINDMNTQIASAAEEQSAVADDINRNVINIGQVANEVAGGADESSKASAELTKLAEQQRRLINQFRV